MAESLTIQAKGTTTVFLRSSYDKIVSKRSIWVERGTFYGALNPDAEISSKKKSKRKKKKSEGDVPNTPEVNPYLATGFDTEFKTPVDPLTRSDYKDGKPFVPHQVPTSANVIAALKAAKRGFPGLPIELFLVPSTSTVDMPGALDARLALRA